MKRLVEFNLEDGSTILVESEDTEAEGEMIRVSSGSTHREIVNFSNKTFEESLGILKPVANTILSKLSDISKQPEEVQVSFGISLNMEAGMFISANTGANFNVTLTWRNK
ncbi:MAG: hypothetical protein QG646_2047 [Euryarchaeota archaeon]|nr:hypothetical protein [Euryarchaeota archaeon]